MTLIRDLKTIYRMARPIRGETHGERMDSFYGHQAYHYDEFRKRLLSGRRQLHESSHLPRRGIWVDMGGGTGSNLEFMGEEVRQFEKIYIVDVSCSLLAVAASRIRRHRWTNVEIVNTDATAFEPPEAADLVTFSYSLSMIPQWFAAIDQAFAILKDGGRVGVVDFYVSQKFSNSGRGRHNWWTRTFWPAWFASDNVQLTPDHLEYLSYVFEELEFASESASMPFLPLLGRVPYYRFIGSKV